MSAALILYGEDDPLLLLELRNEIAARRSELAQRELAIGDLRHSLLSFEGRYIRQVGILYKQLDEWNTKREELHKKPEESDALEEEPIPEVDALPSALELRRLFREVAKRIHPDHALDADDTTRRTRLMSQANEALRRWDRATLLRMLHGHEAATPESRVRQRTLQLQRELHALREDIGAADAEWASLVSSELAQLREGVLTAARDGRDLLAEMAVRVQGLIGIAMRQYELDLDRIRRPGRGMAVDALLSAEAPPEATPRYDAKLRRWIR